MPGQKKQTLLAMEIAETLHVKAIKHRASRLLGSSVSRQILLAGVALATLQPGIAEALAIGDLNIHSALGQPFVATTTARVGAGEKLVPGCVTAVADMPGGNASSLALTTTVAALSATGEYPIRVSSRAPLYEPMYEIQLNVSCPGIAALARNYIVMLDVSMTSPLTQVEASTAPELPVVTSNVRVGNTPAATKETAVSLNESTSKQSIRISALLNPDSNPVMGETTSPAQSSTTNKAIQTGSDYSVQRGDTLLTIAQEVEGRTGFTTRQVADAIYQANPRAFIEGNPDLIKMGFFITVPSQQALSNYVNNRPSEATDAGSLKTATTVPSDESLKPTNPGTATNTSESMAGQTATAAAAEPIAQLESPAESATTSSIPGVGSQADSAVNTPDTTNEATLVSGTESNEAPVNTKAITPATGPDLEATKTQLSQLSEATTLAGTTLAASASGLQNAASTAESKPEPAATPTKPAAQSPRATTTPAGPTGPNQIMAAGSGIFVGGLLAALIFGRGLIATWLPGRLQRERKQTPETAAEQFDTMINTDVVADASAAAYIETSDDQPVSTMPAEPAHDLPIPEDSPDDTGIDLDVSTETAGATFDKEADQAGIAEAEIFSSAADAQLTEPADEMPVPNEDAAPRISLRDAVPAANEVDFDLSDLEEPPEHTRRYSNPSMLAEDKLSESLEQDGASTMHGLFAAQEDEAAGASDLDVTSTMHHIFANEADLLADNAETTEISHVDSAPLDTGYARVNIDDTSSLQSLSETIASGNSDDELSKTLTQALVLLEQDYEDELTNSQILEQKDIQKAFAEQAAKDI